MLVVMPELSSMFKSGGNFSSNTFEEFEGFDIFLRRYSVG